MHCQRPSQTSRIVVTRLRWQEELLQHSHISVYTLIYGKAYLTAGSDLQLTIVIVAQNCAFCNTFFMKNFTMG